MQITEQDVLQRLVDYAEACGIAESTVGKRAVNDGKLVSSLRSGNTITLKTLQRIERFITDNPAPSQASDQPRAG